MKAGAAFTKMVWGGLGVRYLRWRAFGKSCPYCTNMDGHIVAMDGFFLASGAELAPEGTPALKSRQNIGHPPLHGGCDCMIVPA